MIKFSGQKQVHLFSAVVLSAVLLFAGWPAGGFAPILLFAFVPLLALEDYFFENKQAVKHRAVFFYSYLSFFTWNILTTWWIYFASGPGSVAANFFNSLFMATVFSLFHKARCRLGSLKGYMAFIFFWTAFEYLHINWDLSWPWLTLGNGLAAFPKLYQWYEYTGTLGGSLWILLSNVLIYRSLKILFSENPQRDKALKLVSYTAIVILLPVIISEYMYFSYKEVAHPVKVAVIQPNIDPYNEKFSKMTSRAQIDKMLNLGAGVIDSTTDYLIGPETALPYSIWEDQLHFHHDIKTLTAFLARYPNLQLVVGASTNLQYDTIPPNETARRFTDGPQYYDSYNTAIQIDNTGKIQLHHKSRLVIGVEKIPYPAVFKYFEKFAINLGGASGSLGTQPSPSVFESPDDIKIAPVICYESIYGEYIAEYIRKGAQFIFIITNDGWWGDTPGYRHHMQYARLHAIETRRSVARSANTGISGFINQRGDIIEKTNWWEPAAIQQTINANDKLTFYVKYGDYPGIMAAVFSVVLLIFTFLSRILIKHVK